MGTVEGFTMRNFIFVRNIVRIIKSRRIRRAGHVARMEEGRNAFKILTGTLTGKRPLGSYRIEDGRKILERILKE